MLERAALDEGRYRIVVSGADLKYIASAGLGAIMGAMRLEVYAGLGLVAAVLGFAAVLVAVGLRRNAAAFDRPASSTSMYSPPPQIGAMAANFSGCASASFQVP